MASGGIYRWTDKKDDRDVPDCLSAIYEYGNNFHINYSCYFGNDHYGYGEQLCGNEGTIRRIEGVHVRIVVVLKPVVTTSLVRQRGRWRNHTWPQVRQLPQAHDPAEPVSDHGIPPGCDQVIPPVLARWSFLHGARLGLGGGAPGAFVGAVAGAVHEDLVAGVDEPVQE